MSSLEIVFNSASALVKIVRQSESQIFIFVMVKLGNFAAWTPGFESSTEILPMTGWYGWTPNVLFGNRANGSDSS
jgi:hypothetical protein